MVCVTSRAAYANVELIFNILTVLLGIVLLRMYAGRLESKVAAEVQLPVINPAVAGSPL
jgi:hypothetical protein